MKKLSFILISLFWYSNIMFAQTEPDFIMPIWFEDAVGNRDTVWMGKQDGASYAELNPEYGEEAITAPFDHIFEVRAVHSDENSWGGWEFSKIIIEDYEPLQSCALFARPKIFVHAIHFPVKVSWEVEPLISDEFICAPNTVLSRTSYIEVVPDWTEIASLFPGTLFCMSGTDHIYLDETFKGQANPFYPYAVYEISGSGIDTIWGLQLTSIWDAPHCLTTLPTEEIVDEQPTIYPNPCIDYLQVTGVGSSYDRFQLFDIQGRLLLEGERQDEISVRNLEKGVHVILFQNANGSAISHTFVKM